MQVNYQKGAAIIFGFPIGEWRVAVAILKALNKAQPQDWITGAIADIEGDMMPKAIVFVNDHICENCKMMMNVKDPNCFNMITRDLAGKEESKWIHYQCPVLKQPYK